jgi:hypothetical protein
MSSSASANRRHAASASDGRLAVRNFGSRNGAGDKGLRLELLSLLHAREEQQNVHFGSAEGDYSVIFLEFVP